MQFEELMKPQASNSWQQAQNQVTQATEKNRLANEQLINWYQNQKPTSSQRHQSLVNQGMGFNSGVGSLSGMPSRVVPGGNGNRMTNSSQGQSMPSGRINLMNQGNSQGQKMANRSFNLLEMAKNSYNQQSGAGSALSGTGINLMKLGQQGFQGSIANASKYAVQDVQDGVNAADENAMLAGEAAWRGREEQLQERGINPNSGRFSGMAERKAINLAALRSGTRNGMRINLMDRNFRNSANLGRINLAALSTGANMASSGGYQINNAAQGQNGMAQQWLRAARDENKDSTFRGGVK